MEAHNSESTRRIRESRMQNSTCIMNDSFLHAVALYQSNLPVTDKFIGCLSLFICFKLFLGYRFQTVVHLYGNKLQTIRFNKALF